MIVVHETADDATIWEEINYEKNTRNVNSSATTMEPGRELAC